MNQVLSAGALSGAPEGYAEAFTTHEGLIEVPGEGSCHGVVDLPQGPNVIAGASQEECADPRRVRSAAGVGDDQPSLERDRGEVSWAEGIPVSESPGGVFTCSVAVTTEMKEACAG